MQRTLKGVVAAIMATILALAGVTAAQAQDAQSTHLAYTRYLKSTNGNVVAAFSAFPGNDYRTAQIPNSQEQIVYCFNMPKAPPYELSWVTGPKTTSGQWPKWDRAYGELHQYAGSPRAASIDANVLKVIYNGYDGGNDRAGIQKKYNLSDAEFREATQQAVWYYTDRFGFSSAYGWNIVAAAKALAGLDQSTQLKNPPSKSTLEIFKANNSSFQNLLGVKFVDEETGEPVDDDCGCEYPKVDIVRNEDGSVTIITQSGPGEENIKKETISAPKVTLTDVINTEGRNGVKIEVVNPDGSKDSKTVWGGLDGKDGKDGVDGKDGKDGVDGKSVTAITERGENEGKTGSWIRTYIVEADGSRGELISETFVEDGQNGTDGKDGLSVTAITERGENEGKTGSWIRTYIVEADGSRGELISETFVEDGQDGTDGVDGKSVTAITERGEQGGQTGSWIRTYIVEADGSLGDPISVTFVKDGKDGKDGQDGQTPDVPETDQGNVIETENGKVEVERGEDGKVIIITRDGKNDETNRIEFPKGWDTEHGKINNITTERNKDGKLILHVVFEDGTKESYDVEKGTKVEVNKNVNLNSSVGSTDNDTLNRCLANAAESPLVWLIPIGVLAGVGGPLLQPYMGVFQEQIDKINADLSGQFQFNRDRDPFGIGGRGADNQNSQWGEFQARINDANRQFQEALGGPQAQQAGQVAVALIGVIAAGSAIYKWCTTEPTASADATETAKLSS